MMKYLAKHPKRYLLLLMYLLLLLDKESSEVQMLCEIANSVTGENKEPFTMSGGTYAHRLPNAYVFGTDGGVPPADYPKGRGGAHGLDEVVSIARIKRMMKIYARTFLALNGYFD
jgi:succinyl-diaminopimelate desuccinylase